MTANSCPLTQWIDRRGDLIIGVDHQASEVWLYSGEIVDAGTDRYQPAWPDQERSQAHQLHHNKH